MRSQGSGSTQIATLVMAILWATGGLSRGSEIQFNRDIRPILSEHCFPCHGPDGTHREAELRLDIREIALAAEAIVPGDVERSTLIARIESEDADQRMPPPSFKKALTSSQKDLLGQWIANGASYQKHWSYERPAKQAVPLDVHPIDYLVRQRLKKLGIAPSPLADGRTLVRRLSFDLLGLPPTMEEVEQFCKENTNRAYSEFVDRLLLSPHYGERMAIAWLDVVRFADTIGYHSDNPRSIWPYRDWVIRSFNDNKRFDRFTIEQIAGDLLPDANDETRVASAFNRLVLSTEEGGAQPKDYEARMLADRVRAVGATWLGQTTGCAQCHDHKFDPFTSRDFYALGAFFADITEDAVGRREDGMPVLNDELRQRLQEVEKQLNEAKARDELTLIAELKATRDSILALAPKCLISVSNPTPRIVRILPRGNWMDETGEVVRPAFPNFLSPESSQDQVLTRRDLATWLIAPEHPLTSRVVMNRLWKHFFGAGLSRIPDDLGSQGEMPSNLELLDWLACEFMDSGWNVKHMVRLLVTSETYRQSSDIREDLQTVDPENREWARQNRFRLDAESVRDNSLAVSGLLSRTIGGPSSKPYQPGGYWENLNFPTREYVADVGESQHRRGLYVWWQRTFLHPSFLAFDAPSREECVADRARSNIPQQALVLLNDPTFLECHRVFALRALQDCAGQDRIRIQWMWQRGLQRQPSDLEVKVIQEVLAGHRQAYDEVPGRADKLLEIGQSVVPNTVDRVELAAWTHVARVLMNLHEFITRS